MADTTVPEENSKPQILAGDGGSATTRVSPTEHVTEISSDLIDDPHDPMRSSLDREALFELADNIKQNGLINPITVRLQKRVGEGGTPGDDSGDAGGVVQFGNRYEVVAGHRRFSACKIAGIIKIPCVVRELTDDEAFAVKVAENLERVDVDPVDEGRTYRQFMEQTGMSVAELAKKVRRSAGYVESRLAVGGMDEYMQEGVKTGALKLGVALALSAITDANLRRVWTEMAIRDGISVAQAEHWVRGWELNQLPGGTYDPNPPAGFEPAAPAAVKFKCALSGIEDDCRHYKMVPIHETQLQTLAVVAAEMQKEETEAKPPSEGGEAAG